MHARFDDHDDFWEVRDGNRWWTVHIRPSGAAHICNEKLAVVKPSGALGKRILRAVAAARSTHAVERENPHVKAIYLAATRGAGVDAQKSTSRRTTMLELSS